MSYIGKENMCLRSLDFQSSLKYRFHNVDLEKFIINHVYTKSKPTVKTIRLTWLPSVRCKHGWLHFCVPSTHVLWPLHWHGGQLVKNHCWPGQTRSVRKFSTFVTGPLKPPGMQVPVPRFEPSSHQPQAGSSYIFKTKKNVEGDFNETPVRIQPGIRNSYDAICMSSFSYRHLLLRVHFVVQMSPHLQVAGSPNLGICSHVLSIRCRDHKERKECRRSCQHSDSDLSTTSTDPAKTVPIINVSVSSY